MIFLATAWERTHYDLMCDFTQLRLKLRITPIAHLGYHDQPLVFNGY